MKTALGFGLVLLAAAAPCAFASGAANGADSGALYFVGATAHTVPGYLGVDLRDVTPDQLPALKLKEARGAEIILVDHDAPAGKCGLREHDVVLQMNGQAITGQDQIRRLLHDSPPGTTIVLTISRDGQQLTITTQMANREEVERQAWEQHLTVPGVLEQPDTPAAATDTSAPGVAPSGPSVRAGNSFIGTILMNPSYTGAMLEKMSDQLAGYFGVPSGTGLLVRSVAADSPAALAGMQAGDVVVRAANKPVTTTNDWAKVIKNSHGHSLAVVVLRDRKQQTLTLTPDGKKRSSLDPNSDQPTTDDDLNPVVIARLGLSLFPRS